MTDLMESNNVGSDADAVQLAFSAEAWEVKQALKRVLPAVCKGPALPALTGVRLVASDGRVRVTGTDLEVTISADIVGAKVRQDGVVVVGPKLVAGMVDHATKTKTGGVVGFASEGDELVVSIGKRRRTLRTLPADEYPRLGGIERLAGVVTMSADLFGDVLPAVSGDDARPILASVLVDDGVLVATDSYRLWTVTGPTFADMSVDDPSKFGGILVPRPAVKQIAEIGGNVTLTFDEREASFDWSDEARTNVTTRLVDGEFPQWRGLVPTTRTCAVTFDRAELVAALKSLKRFPLGLNTPARFEATGDGVDMFAVVQDVGVDRYSLTATVDGAPPEAVAYNPDRIAASVAAFAGDQVTLELVDHLKPAAMREPMGDGGERLHLLMPVRIA